LSIPAAGHAESQAGKQVDESILRGELAITQTSTPEPDLSTSLDTDAVAEAAAGFETGNAADAADLAGTAAAEDAVPVERTASGMVAETDASAVSIDRAGEATVSAEGLPDVGIAFDGDPAAVKLIDGAVVMTDAAPSTDVVVHATEEGVQIIAILGSDDAPNDVDFVIDLPENATMVEQADGSIAVMAEVEVETVALDQARRFTDQISAVLGEDYDGVSALTPGQEALVASIPAPEITTVGQEQQVAVIGAPWAVDANGQILETHYEIAGDGIRQVIETDEDTTFPVMADPWWSWLATVAQALYSVANPGGVSNFAFAVALGTWIKVATVASKGQCRYESAWPITVCWGGRLNMLDGYGGGTTYGTTYYAAKDPKVGKTAAAYKDLLNHEWMHTLQWKSLGLGMVPAYLLAEGIGRGLTGGKVGCGNIFEIMAGLKKGGYTKC
jgi:hypothetical protein